MRQTNLIYLHPEAKGMKLLYKSYPTLYHNNGKGLFACWMC